MALNITEYELSGIDVDSNKVPGALGQEPSLATQDVAIGVASAVSVAFQARTAIVRLNCDVTCAVKFGTGTPTAVITDTRLGAGETSFFGVPRGGTFSVAVIN